MFKIYDGREHFFQWDLDRVLIVEDSTITEVHFCNRTDSCSLVCETFTEDGLTLVKVPNILLQNDLKIHVYAYDNNYTKYEECYEVAKRSKPADYIYTETAVKTLVGANYYVDGVATGEIFNNYKENIASNKNSHAEGSKTEATGENAHAEGRKTKASGKHSHAQNYATEAIGESSMAMGANTKAYNKASVAEGFMTEAGDAAVATDVFNPAHAEGFQTKAIGYASHAEGQYNTAKGEAAHAEGSSTIAKADYSHTEGIGAETYDKASHAEGAGTVAGNKPASSGGSSSGSSGGGIPEGMPIADIWAAHAEGIETKASGKASHAEGYRAEATGENTHAEGYNTAASGYAAHAEGENSIASGYAAHTEGQKTLASGIAAHAEGVGTQAVKNLQHVQGKYNIPGGNYAHIVGNGEENRLSNAHTLDWNGNAWFAGDVTVGTGDKLSEKANKMKLLNSFTFNAAVGSVEITKTDDGVDYRDLSIKKLIIFTQTAAKPESSGASTTHMLFKFPDNTNFYTLTQGIGAAQINNEAYFSMLEVDLTKSILHHTGSGCKNGYAATLQYHTSLRGWASTIGNVIKNIEEPVCDGVKWASYTNGVNIPAGSKIEIWGCA